MEEYAYVVDYIPYGDRNSGSSVVQLVGEKYFVLLDAILKENVQIAVGEKVYVGKEIEKREKIQKIRERMPFDRLTASAGQNMNDVLKKMVIADSARYIGFVNNCGPISIRVHQLELIPGIGKKNIKLILEEREKKPFESFADVHARVHTWLDPAGSMAERIKNEITGKERYNIFVTQPPKEIV
jgi:putative nucleotide binding protein